MGKLEVEPKVNKIPEMVGYALSKVFMEKVTQPLVGNSTITSGAFKFGLAMAGDKFIGNNKIGKYAVAGLVLDGTEDIAISLANMILGSGLNIPFIGNKTTSTEPNFI